MSPSPLAPLPPKVQLNEGEILRRYNIRIFDSLTKHNCINRTYHFRALSSDIDWDDYYYQIW